MSPAIREPHVHLRVRIRVAATESHGCCLMIEALEHAAEHGAEIQRNYMHLHPKMRQVVLDQSRHLHALRVRRTADYRELDRFPRGIEQLSRAIPRESG